MGSAQTTLKSSALSLGPDLVGITTRDIPADGPPSADPRSLLPSANPVISSTLSRDKAIVKNRTADERIRLNNIVDGNTTG